MHISVLYELVMDYRGGSRKYWKSLFKDVLQELNSHHITKEFCGKSKRIFIRPLK